MSRRCVVPIELCATPSSCGLGRRRWRGSRSSAKQAGRFGGHVARIESLALQKFEQLKMSLSNKVEHVEMKITMLQNHAKTRTNLRPKCPTIIPLEVFMASVRQSAKSQTKQGAQNLLTATSQLADLQCSHKLTLHSERTTALFLLQKRVAMLIAMWSRASAVASLPE